MSVARYISPEERQALLRELRDPRDRLFFQIGVNTGLRISSILGLRWRQLMQGGEPVAILEVPRRFLKNGRGVHRKKITSRRIPLNAAAAEAVKEWAFARFGSGPVDPEAPVFTSRKRYPGTLGRKQAYTLLRAAAARAGLKKGVAPHGMRRAFAGDVYAATGKDLIATQNLLGHASPLTTALYLKPKEEDLFNVVRNLSAASAMKLGPRISGECSPNFAMPLATMNS
jgi:integrase/recombinase XerD